MFGAIPIVGSGSANAVILVLLATFIGFNYGSNLALFPSFAKDMWGIKNFGVNYGILFTAWGVGGFAMSRASQWLMATTGSFANSFITAGVLLLLGTGLSFLVKDHKSVLRKQVARTITTQAA